MKIAKATSSKDEKINEKLINEVIKDAMNSKSKMIMLFDYISIKLYVINSKWKKILKVLFLILTMLVYKDNEKGLLSFIKTNHARIKTLTKFKFLIEKEDKGMPSKI